ncbi:LamG-like jellyroll fold domain-containing protein [Aquirufa sp. ROCK2-A2]
MKKILTSVFLLFIITLGCTNRESEIIELINSVKKQNDDLKAQITSLKKTTDSAMLAITKVTVSQAITDKKLDAIQADLKNVLSQISSLSIQMTAANADLVSIKAKLDILQLQCADLISQIATLNSNLNETLAGLKKQVAALKNTSDSSLIVISKLNVAQLVNDKNLSVTIAQLRTISGQIAQINAGLIINDVNVESLKQSISVLQSKMNDLLKQLDPSNPMFTLMNGMISYYPFDGSWYDMSGNNNNLGNYNVSNTTDRFGINNLSAVEFNGRNSYFEGPVLSDVKNQLTVSFWIKNKRGTTPTGFRGIVTTQNTNSQGFLIQDHESLKYDFTFALKAGNGYVDTWSTNRASIDKWEYMTFVYDGKSAKIYRNGALENESVINAVSLASTGKLYVGSRYNNEFFIGVLDNLGIWNRALSVEEIKYLYTYGY